MSADFLALVAVGFFAQLVDGALGMAFGLISTTALLTLGFPPAKASAAVHTAEIATTAAAGLSHLYHRNVNLRLLALLGIAGILGGVAGAYVLSNVEGQAIRPFVAAYLLLVGIFILFKAANLAPLRDEAKARHAAPLGLVGGFLDAIGGGGWGAIVSSTLIGSGHAPRQVIGSVSAAEFFVTVAISTTFFIELGTDIAYPVAALILGGLLAAPFGAYFVRHIRPHLLMAAVGLLVSGLAVLQLVMALT